MRIWGQARSWLRDDWEGAHLPAADAALREVELWRMQLVHGLLVAAAIVGPFALAFSAYGAYLRGRVALAIGYGIAYAVVLLIAFWRKVPYVIQVFGILGLLYVMGLSDLLVFGWKEDARLFFLSLSLLSALFFGVYQGFVTLGLTMITITVVGMLGVTGVYPLPPLTESLFIGVAPVSLVSDTVSLAMLGTMLIVGQRYLIPRFIEAVVESRSGVAVLQIQQEELLKQARSMLQVNSTLERRAFLLEGTINLASETGSLLDAGLLLRRGVEGFAKVFELFHVGLYSPTDDGTALELRASSSEAGRRLMLDGFRVPVAGTVPGRVWMQRKPLMVKAGDAHVGWRLQEARSAAVLPLCHAEQCLAILELQSLDAESFGADDLHVLEMAARLFAAALENAHRVSSDARLLEAASPYYRLAQRFAKAQNLQEVYAAALGLVQEQAPQRAFILAFSDDGLSATMAAELRGGQVSFQESRHSIGEWLTKEIFLQEALTSDRPLLIRDVEESPVDLAETSQRTPLRNLATRGTVRSLAFLPFRSGEHLLGVLGVVFQNLHPFTAEDDALYSAVMEYSAAALTRLRLTDTARRRVQMEQQLREFSDQLAHIQSAPTVASSAAQALKTLMEVDGVLVRLVPEGAGGGEEK